jgi:hypothetical protein
MSSNDEKRATLLVGVWLVGEEVSRFLAYKDKSTLSKNATAGRKLLLERLNEVEPKPKREADEIAA